MKVAILFDAGSEEWSPQDVAAVVAGLCDGTIDAVATDHAPHAPESKDRPFDQAPPGMLGLQTALPIAWVVVSTLNMEPIRLNTMPMP